MHNCILPEEMKALEARYMSETSVPSILLMECAAHGVLEAIKRHAEPGEEVVFLCGPGANGGDGYAAARLWQEHGGKALILEICKQAKGDAGINRFLAESAGCLFTDPTPLAFSHASLIVDALFGTGLSRKIDGKAKELLDLANASGIPSIAVDIPSGLDGSTGACLGPVLHCLETVTFHRPKTGLFLSTAPEYTGKVTVAPILIPKSYGQYPGLNYLEPSDLFSFIPSRSPCANKGTFGRTVILAGSEGMAGAAALCASAAITAGSGLTTLLCSAPLLPVLQVLVPAATCCVLPDEPEAKLHTVTDLLRHADRAVIGCGLSQNEALLPLLSVFRQADCPVIWDADALNLLSRHPEMLPLPEKDVITPHPGEAARILGVSIPEILADSLGSLQDLHKKTGAHVLLKGACTLMTNGNEHAVNTLSCPALAKGGSGDILAGILAALIGRVQTADEASRTLRTMQCAVLIHTLAGQKAAETCGADSVMPQDIIRSIRLVPKNYT